MSAKELQSTIYHEWAFDVKMVSTYRFWKLAQELGDDPVFRAIDQQLPAIRPVIVEWLVDYYEGQKDTEEDYVYALVLHSGAEDNGVGGYQGL